MRRQSLCRARFSRPSTLDGIGTGIRRGGGNCRTASVFYVRDLRRGGSTPGHTIAVAKAVAETGVTPLCHLTCVQSTREHVQHVLADMKTAGMENVLALRGDLPKEGEPCHDFAYAAELIDFIHQRGISVLGRRAIRRDTRRAAAARRTWIICDGRWMPGWIS